MTRLVREVRAAFAVHGQGVRWLRVLSSGNSLRGAVLAGSSLRGAVLASGSSLLMAAILSDSASADSNIEELLEDLTDPRKMTDFLAAATLLGKGDYGKAFALNSSYAIKVVDIGGVQELPASVRDQQVVNEVRMQREASLVRTAAGDPCVPPIFSTIRRVHATNPDGVEADFVFFAMPRLDEIAEFDEPALAHIVTLSNCLVEHGFLHNDMHAGNVMLWNGKPIIIDFGLITRQDPIRAEPIRSLVQYAQCAALIDNCNKYSCAKKSGLLGPVWRMRNVAHDIFNQHGIPDWNRELESQEAYVARITKDAIQKFSDCALEIQLQLILAHLSLQFRWCPSQTKLEYDDNICDVGAPIGDAIYAIRSPSDFGYSLAEDLLTDLKNGRVNVPSESD